MNGTLNKLTPDNFDRLVQQITGFVKNAEVLRKAISLVFEKAVAEPTFCALYATLCERLSKQIPDFPPLQGTLGCLVCGMDDSVRCVIRGDAEVDVSSHSVEHVSR